MSGKVLSIVFDKLKSSLLPVSILGTSSQKRYKNKRPADPILRFPYWYLEKERKNFDELLVQSNKEFLKQVVLDKYSEQGLSPKSPLKKEPLCGGEWYKGCQRTGLIAVKLGYMPQWLKDGSNIQVTLLQILDNHVIKYVEPGTPDLRKYALKYKKQTEGMGNLIVGAVSNDPQNFTKEYCGLFTKSGVMPKKIITKFPIHTNAVIQPGTPLYAAHFQVGDVVDVTGQSIYRGFQGVMKRWGFSGMPASHGQTKTHRRPGNIGGGGEKSRVWPGKKMPGHVGYKTVTIRGLTVLRINHKYNVLYVSGCVPGNVNSFVYVHDTLIRARQRETAPPFPTYFPEHDGKQLPEEEFHESIFNFSDPSLVFEEENVSKAKK